MKGRCYCKTSRGTEKYRYHTVEAAIEKIIERGWQDTALVYTCPNKPHTIHIARKKSKGD